MAVVFENRRSRVKHEKTRAINLKALVAFSIPALLGILVFALGIANGMQKSENWTALAVMIVLTTLLAVIAVVVRRHETGSTKSSSAAK